MLKICLGLFAGLSLLSAVASLVITLIGFLNNLTNLTQIGLVFLVIMWVCNLIMWAFTVAIINKEK